MGVYAREYGYFFNSQSSDRKYDASSFETWLKPFFVSGVFAGSLQVTAQSTPNMTVNVSPGYANLDGKPAYWPDTNVMELETASGVYDRIDTIVLRRDNTNRHISIEVVTGTASFSPQPTAPTRTTDIFELVLAEVYVGVGVTSISGSNITDKRPDTSVCGYVMTTIDTPDFSELYAQFSAQAEEFMGEQAADFLAWFDEMKDQLSEDAAGHLQLEIDAITDEIGDTALPTTAQTLTGAIAENNTDLSTLRDEVGIVINGNTAAVNVAPGQFVILKNSTITGKDDGLYTFSGSTTRTAGNSFSASELTAVPNGGLNALNSNITTLSGKVFDITNVHATVAANSNTDVNYPTGFSNTNCVVISTYLYSSANKYGDAGSSGASLLTTGKIRLYNNTAAQYAVYAILMKYSP